MPIRDHGIIVFILPYSSVQFSSVAQSHPTLCDPVDCSTPGLPVHHQLLEFTQTHVQWVGNAIQPSHPLSSPSPPSLNLYQHQGHFQMSQLFASGGQSIGISASTSILPMNIQDWSPFSLRDSQESSPTPQFKSINSSVLSFLYSPTLTSIHDYWKKVMSLLFNMLSKLVITFLPRSKRLLISQLQSPSAVILEPRKISQPLFPLFPHLFAMKWWDQMPWS